jgi:hypothetical protein
MAASEHLGPQFFHGTTADLRAGDTIEPGHGANWEQSSSEHVYFTDSRKAAKGWAKGGRVYEVEPTGEYEPDANFPEGRISSQVGSMRVLPPGGPQYSYQTQHPLRVRRKAR